MKLRKPVRALVISSVPLSMLAQILLTPTIAMAEQRRCVDGLMKKAAAEAPAERKEAPKSGLGGFFSSLFGSGKDSNSAPPQPPTRHSSARWQSSDTRSTTGRNQLEHTLAQQNIQQRNAAREEVGQLRDKARQLRRDADSTRAYLRSWASRDLPADEKNRMIDDMEAKEAQARQLDNEADRMLRGDITDATRSSELDAERAEREARFREQEAERRLREEEERTRRAQLKQEADQVRQNVERSLRKNTDTVYQNAFVDIVTVSQLKSLIKDASSTVFLAIGNSTSKMTPQGETAIVALVNGLIKNGHRIIYDADSSVGELIAEAGGKYVIGVSGRFSGAHDRVLGIQNPVRRMDALLSIMKIVVTPDSVLGTGLLIEGQASKGRDFLVLDPEGKWRQGLSDWKSAAFPEREYGLSRWSDKGRGSWGRQDSLSPADSSDLVQGSWDDRSPLARPRTQPVETRSSPKEEGGLFSRVLSRHKPTELTTAPAPERSTGPANQQQNPPQEGAEAAKGAVATPPTVVSRGTKPIEAPDTNPAEKRESIPNLGIEYTRHNLPIVATSIDTVLKELTARYLFSKPEAVEFEAPTQETLVASLRSTPDESIVKIDGYAKAYALALQLNRVDAKRNNSVIPGGAAVFGSAKGSSTYEKLVYDSVRILADLGVTVATGGSGGFMETANRAATDAGVYSIGIPRGGLPNETQISTSVQNITINTPDYEMRIPALLDQREFLVLAPGGMGTMKELAVVLIQKAATDSGAPIILVSGPYYKDLKEWLQSLPLPSALRQRIHLVETPEQMGEIARGSIAAHPERRNNIISDVRFEKPKPRERLLNIFESSSPRRTATEPSSPSQDEGKQPGATGAHLNSGVNSQANAPAQPPAIRPAFTFEKGPDRGPSPEVTKPLAARSQRYEQTRPRQAAAKEEPKAGTSQKEDPEAERTWAQQLQDFFWRDNR